MIFNLRVDDYAQTMSTTIIVRLFIFLFAIRLFEKENNIISIFVNYKTMLV